MKKNIKWIFVLVILVAVIFGATVLYNRLSAEYSSGSLIENSVSDKKVVAPDFKVTDQNGNEVSLSDFLGKPVVLNFWATWCHYCVVEMPEFNKAYENYPDVQFMMVNATDGVRETVSLAKAYIEKENFLFDVFFDTNMEAVNAYYVTGFPMTFFINKNGELVSRKSGMTDYKTLEKGIKMITD